MITNRQLTNRDYIRFSILVVASIALTGILFFCLSFIQYTKNNQRVLKTEAKNIHNIIFDTFEQSNRINTYIGRQIASHGSEDLSFILSFFRETYKIQNTNSELISWSSFDFVNTKNLQVVNNRLGIRKNPPNMSMRQYTTNSPKNPWQLEVSFPVFGNPSGIWVIPAGTGITDKSGKYLGIVVVGFNISEFISKIQQKLSDTNVSFVVLDKDSNIVFQSVDNLLKLDDNFYKKLNLRDKFQSKFAILEDKITVGDIEYSVYYKMEKYPYIILTGFNKSFLLKNFINLILPRVLTLIITTIFFLFILYLFKTRMSYLLDKEKKLSTSLRRAIISRASIIQATSHDLRNYIFGISGLAKLLLDNKESYKNEELGLIKSISEQCDEFGYFVEDLLDINQNESGVFNLGTLEECDLKKLIHRMVLLNKGMTIKNQINVITNIEENLPKLKCDIRRMKQIFSNLITNAIKYSSANTTLTITAKFLQNQNKIYIEFKDEGIGMSDEEIKMALNGNGEKIDKTALDKEIDSHGIGIPIVKRLVELHEGKLEIESKKREGSKIKLYFNPSPRNRETSSSQIMTTNSSRNILQNKKILAIDDNPINIKITSAVLEKAGCKNIATANNGSDAILLMDKEDFDLILTDVEMPGMNGYETTQKIRKGKCFKNFKNYKNIPIIALTSNIDHETIGRVKDCGMNGHLSKTNSTKEILDIIEEFLT